MTVQQKAAMQAMIDWLAHELGHPPSKINLAGEFTLHGMHYSYSSIRNPYLENGFLVYVEVMKAKRIWNIVGMHM